NGGGIGDGGRSQYVCCGELRFAGGCTGRGGRVRRISIRGIRRSLPGGGGCHELEERGARRGTGADYSLRNEADGWPASLRFTVARIYICRSHRPLRGSGWRRHGTPKLDGHRSYVRGGSRGGRSARIFSCVECETHSPAHARTGGLYEGAVHAGALVRGRSDELLRVIRPGAFGALVEEAVLRRFGIANQRTAIAPGSHVAKRGSLEP